MQEFTTKIKGLTKGLRPTDMQRTTGMLVECLNMQPMPGDKLVSISALNFPPFQDTYEVLTDPLARNDYFYIYIDETVSANILENDDSWNANDVVVTAVNGQAGNVGVSLPHASGGTFRLDADGSFVFDPDGDYALDVGEVTTITITYTVTSAGLTANGTISIRIHGKAAEAEDPGGGVEPFLLIQPQAGDSTVFDIMGNTVVLAGVAGIEVLSDPVCILMPGATQDFSGRYIKAGIGGEFDFMYNGESSWTLEYLWATVDPTFSYNLFTCQHSGQEVTRLYFEIGGAFEGEKWAGGALVDSTGEPLEFGIVGPTEEWPLTDIENPSLSDIGHIAVVADMDSPQRTIKTFLNGVLKESVDVNFAALDQTTGSSTLAIGGAGGWASMKGLLKGVRLTKAALYTDTFTPPSEF